MTQKKFERWLLIFVAVLVVLRFTAAYLERPQRTVMMDDGPSLPRFEWWDFESEKHSIKELEGKGKTIVLHFWASWCGPCREEFPSMLKAAAKLKGDVVFLTISGDESDIAAKKFVQSAKNMAKVSPDNVLYGQDPLNKIVYDIFQTSALPETIIVDPDLRMRSKFAGTVDWNNPELLNYIRTVKDKPIESKVPTPK